jgi:hypothetical protein
MQSLDSARGLLWIQCLRGLQARQISLAVHPVLGYNLGDEKDTFILAWFIPPERSES